MLGLLVSFDGIVFAIVELRRAKQNSLSLKILFAETQKIGTLKVREKRDFGIQRIISSIFQIKC